MLEETHDSDQIIQRVAALDVGKAEVTWGKAGPHSGYRHLADKRRCRPAGGARSRVKIGAVAR